MLEEDFDKFRVYTKDDEYTMYTNDATDYFNSYLQAFDHLRHLKVFVARKTGTMQAEYIIVDDKSELVYHHLAMQGIEDYINERKLATDGISECGGIETICPHCNYVFQIGMDCVLPDVNVLSCFRCRNVYVARWEDKKLISEP